MTPALMKAKMRTRSTRRPATRQARAFEPTRAMSRPRRVRFSTNQPPTTATIRIGKRTFYEQREMGLKQAYDHASAVMVENMLARDAEEGIGAFVEKRDPSWEHR